MGFIIWDVLGLKKWDEMMFKIKLVVLVVIDVVNEVVLLLDFFFKFLVGF